MSRHRKYPPSTWKGLSPRQKQVILGVEHNMTNLQIGRALGIEEDTVRIHLRQIVVKFEGKIYKEIRENNAAIRN